MLSILIPVYNYNCVNLVTDLHHQCLAEKIDFEIIVADDVSTQWKNENRSINELVHCEFVEQNKKSGRAKIRNELAKMATYNFLLFLDADARVQKKDFIREYLAAIDKADVLVGGVTYAKNPPAKNPLRWWYGKQREFKTANERNQAPYQSFLSFNFLTQKEVIQKATFNAEMLAKQSGQYGHEDTLLGIKLKQKGFTILHLDNQLIHNNKETNEEFIAKSLSAVEGYVTNPELQQKEAITSIRIFRVFNRIKNCGATFVLDWWYQLFEKKMKRQLFKTQPSLFVFDLYRLSYLGFFYRKNKKNASSKEK